MAGDAEGQEARAAPATGVDAVVAALALGGASREKVDAFLDDQRALIADQRHHLKEQFKQLSPALWEIRLGVALRAATMAVGLAAAAGIAVMIWNASRSNELIVDSFSVPPDLAQKGVSGQVLAGQLVDRLVEMQGQTTSFRAAQTYANHFADSIKLEIPETGVSFAELNRFLRETLGDNKHISGELIRAGAGFKLSVRVTAGGSDSVVGGENDLDTLVQRAAEAIYNRTQPFRYATYVWIKGGNTEANRLFLALAKSDSPMERSWAYVSVGTTSVEADGNNATDQALVISTRFARRAAEISPGNALAWSSLSQSDELLGRSEDELFDVRQAQAAMSGRGAGMVRADAVLAIRKMLQSRIDGLLGEFHAAAKGQADFVESGNTGMNAGASPVEAVYQAREHDAAAARATLAERVPPLAARAALEARHSHRAEILLALSREDWRGVLSAAALAGLLDTRQSEKFSSEESWIALAEAELGRFSDAEARIKPSPTYCNPCLITRARIAELQGQRGRADYWFAKAARDAPSIPFAYLDWGRALLVRGDANSAITKFKLANQKGPHFADALEGWGEALMAKNQSHLALTKFAEAEKYAPNWGRLHLKWGEALTYAGKKDEAPKHFTRAAQLDLTPSEKAEWTQHP